MLLIQLFGQKKNCFPSFVAAKTNIIKEEKKKGENPGLAKNHTVMPVFTPTGDLHFFFFSLEYLDSMGKSVFLGEKTQTEKKEKKKKQRNIGELKPLRCLVTF